MSTQKTGKHAARTPRGPVLSGVFGRTSPGRHKHVPQIGPTARLVSTAPRVVGAVALTVATGGAMNLQGTVDDSRSSAEAATASSLAAAPVSAPIATRVLPAPEVLAERAVRVSRDASRVAAADARREARQKARARARKQEAAEAARRAAEAERAAEIARAAWHLPVAAGAYRLSSSFGECSALWSNCHTGLDFAAPSGTPVAAVATGVVTAAGYDGAYGNRLILTLQDGTEVWYCHLTSFAVSAGQAVSPGQTLGSVGSTGNTTGPHLHLEMRPGGGDAVDPYAALAGHGVQL